MQTSSAVCTRPSPTSCWLALGSPKREKWINMNYPRGPRSPFVLGAVRSFDFLADGVVSQTGEPGKHFSKFTRAILRQWWRLRAKKSSIPVVSPNVMPDPVLGT